MVTLIQRFARAANLNIHLHCLVLDGLYRNRDGLPVFHKAAPPTVRELEVLLAKIIKRVMRLLTRLGAVIEEPDQTYLAETDTDEALACRQAASCTYRTALGPRAGQKVLSLQSLPSQARPPTPELNVNAHGFSLHAAVRWRAAVFVNLNLVGLNCIRLRLEVDYAQKVLVFSREDYISVAFAPATLSPWPHSAVWRLCESVEAKHPRQRSRHRLT